MLLRLTAASAPLTHEIDVRDEFGAERTISIPAERPLTVFVDKRELVTLMTLGAAPELLVLGYLRNQRLVDSVDDVDSITVDWDVDAAAVKTRAGIERFDEKTAKRVVTTGCGQGTVFGDLMGDLDAVAAAAGRRAVGAPRQAALYGLLDAIRAPGEHLQVGRLGARLRAVPPASELLTFVEDVGRHNAIDTIAGWMWLHDVDGGDKIFYTTGRLTSEMVIKSAQMGVPIVVSRSGITQMGYELAAAPRPDAVRPGDEPPLHLLLRLRPLRRRARAAAADLTALGGAQPRPSNIQTSTRSPAATLPCSWPSTTRPLASLMLRRMPEPCAPVDAHLPGGRRRRARRCRAGTRCGPASCGSRATLAARSASSGVGAARRSSPAAHRARRRRRSPSPRPDCRAGRTG